MKLRSTLIGLAALLLITSCKETQSSFALEDIKTVATVKGKLYFLQGATFNANQYAEILAYPEGKKVWIDLNLSSFGSNGTKTYETVMDKDGNYAVQIPVSVSGSDITVRFESFEGTFNIENNQTIGQVGSEKIISQKTLYAADPIDYRSVKPNDIKIYSGVEKRYKGENIDFFLEFNEVFEVRGKIMQNFERKVNQPAELFYASAPYNGVVELTVEYNEPQGTIRKFYGTSTSNSTTNEGEYSIKIPVKGKRSTLKSIVVTAEKKGQTFVHYTSVNEGNGTTMNGYFEERNNYPVGLSNCDVDLNTYTTVVIGSVLKMKFIPYYGETNSDNYNMVSKWNNWYNDPYTAYFSTK